MPILLQMPLQHSYVKEMQHSISSVITTAVGSLRKPISLMTYSIEQERVRAQNSPQYSLLWLGLLGFQRGLYQDIRVVLGQVTGMRSTAQIQLNGVKSDYK